MQGNDYISKSEQTGFHYMFFWWQGTGSYLIGLLGANTTLKISVTILDSVSHSFSTSCIPTEDSS